ncbi:hypothetical protein GUJ93_ZPchr0014g47503 [Zizania palustris]|uniref:Uncharacterized protein n=1 Tax=Zizania palustris TaxID=103762 RepID=A0A8J5TAW5_ZIZPA|nr:hypothetical protein GUJ93_ZPchr0014g47503 [Zizania palustris]
MDMAISSIVVDFPPMGIVGCFSSLESFLRDSTSCFLAIVSAAPDSDNHTNFARSRYPPRAFAWSHRPPRSFARLEYRSPGATARPPI